MNYSNVVTSLNIPSQLPLDYKIWYRRISDITLGENDYLAYTFYQGMLVYCAEERVLYEWNDESIVNKSETHKLFPNHFVYPSDMPEVNGVEYANKKYNFFKVSFRNEDINIEDYVTYQEFRETIDAILEDILINKGDIANIKGELGLIEGKITNINQAIANLKNYTDAQNEALKAEMELRDKALQDELTDAEARQLLALENQRRDLEAQIARQSELLLESVQDLQESLDSATTNLQNSINNLQIEINNLPTNVQLTKAQLDNLKMLANIIDQEYKDVNFKANVVLRDKFLPASEKPAIEALQLDCRTKHNALQAAITQAIADETLTEAELDDINNKIDIFRLSVEALNNHLLDVYDLLSDNMEQYYLNLIDSKIVEVEFEIQYSANGTSGWHNPPFVDGTDKYMRMRNGAQSAWSDPMKIVGENGSNGLASFKSTAFIKSIAIPATPTGGTWASPIPTTAGWSDGVPSGDLPLYMSTRIFTSTGAAPQQATWTAPKLVSDTVDLEYKFSSVAVNPGNPTNNGANWVDTATPTSIWMALRKRTNGVWSSWDITKIKGEDGRDGVDGVNGVYQEFQFALSDSLNTAPTSGWQDAPPTPTVEKPYLWCRTGTVVPPATEPSSWTGFSMSGPAGPPGEGTSTVVSSVEPEDKELGMIWIDTGVSPIQQKYWDGNMWIIIGLTQSDLTNAIQTANDALKDTMEQALEDGIISAGEAQNIANNIASLKSTKRVLDAQTSIVRNDPALGSVEKANLTTAKTTFDIKHNDLLTICETIATQTSVTPAQVQNYNTAQAAYDTALEALTRELEIAQNNILANTVGGISVGGRNLLLDTRRTVTNATYKMAEYALSDPTLINEGGEYTITIWGNLGTGRTKFTVYNDNTSGPLGDLGLVSPGVYSGTFRWNSRSTPNTKVNVYQSPSTGTSTSTINYIKLERGNRYSDWTPAPEDVQAGIDHAILNAANAEAIANAARERVNFLSVSIDPDIGLIIGSTLMVGNSQHGNAFISGVSDRTNEAGEDISIRFGAGPGGYTNKETVPFRVNDKGELFASKGKIAGWEITEDSFNYEYSNENEGQTQIELNPKKGGVVGIGYAYQNPTTNYEKSTARRYEMVASQRGTGFQDLLKAIGTYEHYGDNASPAIRLGASIGGDRNADATKVPYPIAWMKEYARSLSIGAPIYSEETVVLESIRDMDHGTAISVEMGDIEGKPSFKRFYNTTIPYDRANNKPTYDIPSFSGFKRGDAYSGGISWKGVFQYFLIYEPSGSLQYVQFTTPPTGAVGGIVYMDIDGVNDYNFDIEKAFSEGRFFDVMVDNSSGTNVEIQVRIVGNTNYSVERFIVPSGKSKVSFLVVKDGAFSNTSRKMKMVVFVFPTI